MSARCLVLCLVRFFMTHLPKRVWGLLFPGAGLILAALAGLAIRSGWQAWRGSAEQVAARHQVAFNTIQLDRSVSSGVEWLNSRAVFRDAAFFGGHIYLAGLGGLYEYGTDGTLTARYLVGRELPAVPLVSLAVGPAPDSAAPKLFVATAGAGLLIFDGESFLQVRAEELAYRKLTAVLPLATGRVLLGTEKKGVLAFDGERLVPFHPALADLPVTTLAGDEGNLWVGTIDRGVLHWTAGQVEVIGPEDGLPDPQILSLAVTQDGVFVGTPMGVAEFRNGGFQRVLASGFFARTLLIRKETLVVGTLEEGQVEIPLEARATRVPRPRGSPVPQQVERLLENDGVLYALAEDGLYAVDNRSGDWRHVLQAEDALLTDSNIAAVAVDATGKLWVGYFDRGLDIIELNRQHATHVENEHVFCVNRIVPDPERGLTAVATANGLVFFDIAGQPRQVLGRAEGLIANHITDILLRSGGMTIATPAGLTFLDGSGMRSLYAFHGLVNNHAYTLATSGERVLVGTLGGLSVLDGDVVRANFTTANSGLRHNWITAIVPVGQGWFVGTYGAGILQLDATGHWETFPEATGRFEINPNAMVVTESRVYAGTVGQGLYVYNRATGRWTAITAGLPSRTVTAIAVHGGYVYAGTDNGLVRILESGLLIP